MFLDLRAADTPDRFEADVCIVGAGAAGISLATALAGSKLRVLLLESGGMEFDAATQELYSGAMAGLEYAALDTARLRWFGGTTNHWLGMSAPLQPIDLARRDWVPMSGWPIGRAELDPFYARAQPVLDLGPFDYDTQRWLARFHRHNPFPPEGFVPEFWQNSHPPTRMGEKYAAAIRAAENVTAVLHANVTGIRLAADGGRVERLELRTLEGRAATVRARAVVLACGGIENARLLLASDDVRPAGVGNDRDMVGRCFMEHPELWKPAVGVLEGDLQWALAFRSGETSPYNIMHLRPSDAMQAREGILNTSLHVTTRLRSDPGAGYAALGRARQGGWWERARALGSALVDPGDVLDGVYSRFVDRQYIPRLVGPTEAMIRVRSEQSPDRDSRVTLDGERDALGMRRVRLDWRMNALDKRTVAVALEAFARELGRLRRGRLRIEEWVGADATSWPDSLEWGYHHMGTTRMSADPREGVVDADCAVHGVGGLYVAGSSVFPTGGYVNPTLTIVALALRLGDHLRGKLA